MTVTKSQQIGDFPAVFIHNTSDLYICELYTNIFLEFMLKEI